LDFVVLDFVDLDLRFFRLSFDLVAPIGVFAALQLRADAFAAGGPSTFAACALPIPMES
jgi:hypothetical protein